MPARRTFLLVHNRAVATGDAPLDDLAGGGGRFDLVARFVTQALLTSHGVRTDTDAVVLFTNTPDEPVALRVRGAEVEGLRPDERNAAAKLNQALVPVAFPVWQDALPGIATRTVELPALLDELPDPRVLLDEAGDDLHDKPPGGGATFVVGDDRGLTDAQHAQAEARCERVASVGPAALQADQVVVVVHNLLDRTG